MGQGQVRDEYYLRVARTVREAANCLGSRVGAVVVLRDRIVATGYNGTPAGFPNCLENGCVRCLDSHRTKTEPGYVPVDAAHRSGAALDRCICVHGEQNAFMSAARFGIPLEGAVLYSTTKPCFTCLKEACQIGIRRVVFGEDYDMGLPPKLEDQYEQLVAHLSRGEDDGFSYLPFPPEATDA